MKGRKRKPTALKLLEGNRSKRKLNPNEPAPPPMTPDSPAELADDVEASAEWARTVVPAIYRRQVTTADRAFAIAYCSLWSTWRSQLADAAKHAHVIAVNGRPATNPARRMANQTLLLLAKVAAELGFTPASRGRVETAKDSGYGEADSWADVLG